MGMLDWLIGRDKASGNGGSGASTTVNFDKGEEFFAGLNMKEAIDAHVAWRKKLEKAIIDKSTDAYEIHLVATDNNCIMGKWLYNEAKHFSNLTEYGVLRKAHADFHMLAGEILMEIRDGHLESAAARIKTDLRNRSDQVQLTLIRLCTKANDPTR